ncbi:MAG: hypothetical protein AAGD01_20550 [Acidobacteriota bacterium]
MLDSLANKISLDWLKRLQLIQRMKWESTETKLAWLGAALIITGWRLPTVDALQPILEKLPWGPIALLGLGTALILYFLYRSLQFIYSPLSIPEVKGTIVRGASAFTKEDGEFFKKLGRQKELGKLRDWILDPQVPAILVIGESGVGKTSLLRAGVQNLVELDMAYWEATATDPIKRFRQSIQKQFDNEPNQLKNSVLLIDQSEQLGSDRSIFELLGQHIQADPPYGTTWIVAMRRDYIPDWFEWSEEHLQHPANRRIRPLTLKHFSPQRARETFSILAEEAGLTVREEVLQEIITNISEKERVSPVDLAISLQVLARHPEQAQDPKFFLSIGGHNALLTSYVEGELEIFDEETQRAIYRSLLQLIDLDLDRRKADGFTLEELESIAKPANRPLFSQALKRLELPTVRVLELSEGRYRLLHEGFIPAIRRLADDALSTSEQASRLLARRYQNWVVEGKSTRYLMTGRELTTINNNIAEINRKNQSREIRNFLKSSVKRHHSRRRRAIAAVFIALLGTGIALQWWHSNQVRREMQAAHFPGGFYEILPQVRSIELTRHRIGFKLDWLHRATQLEELTLSGQGLRRGDKFPSGLTKLKWHPSEISVINAPEFPNKLKQLELYIDGSNIERLPTIPDTLTHLTLAINRPLINQTIPTLPSKLEQLSIRIRGGYQITIPPLPTSLRELSVDIDSSRFAELPEFPNSLQELELRLKTPKIQRLPLLPHHLDKLTVEIISPGTSAIPDFPSQLKELHINLKNSQVTQLPPFPSSIKKLTLNLEHSKVDTLPDLPKDLTYLDTDLRTLISNNFFRSTQNLETISLHIVPRELRHLQTSNLSDFNRASAIHSDLDPRSRSSIRYYRQAPLLPLPIPGNFDSSQIDSLGNGNLQLSFDLSNFNDDTLPAFPKTTTALSIDARGSNLKHLPRFPENLSHLSLFLRDFAPEPFTYFDQESSSRVDVENIPPLPAGLSQLSLSTDDPQAMSRILIPFGIDHLELDVSNSAARQLPRIAISPSTLSLDISRSLVLTLPTLPESLTYLSFNLDHSLVTSLPKLPNELMEIRLSLKESSLRDLERITEKSNLEVHLRF